MLRNGRTYYDGAIGSSVPISYAMQMGAKSLVVLDVTSPTSELDHPTSFAELVSYVSEVYCRQIVRRELADHGHIPMVYPTSSVSPTMSTLDLDHTEELLVGGYKDATGCLDELGL